MTHRYLIVGSGVAGLSAAEEIRRREPAARITLVSAESHPFYSRPGLAYLITGDVPERQLAVRTPRELRELRLERIAGLAVALDARDHVLTLDDGQRLPWDRLLVAMGAASIAPAFPGAHLEGVVRLDGLDDARRLLALARDADAAAVVGGGSTALELVDGLLARGVRTHYLLRGERYWSRVLDPVESEIVEDRLIAEGCQLHRETEVSRAVGRDGRLVALETRDGRTIPCDVLAVAVGVRPRLDLARATGLDVDRGILTNEWLETSAPDIFAAGDVAQVRDPATGEALLDTLWASAMATGRSAGANMTGVRTPHRKRPAMNVTRIAGVTTTIVGAVGGADDPDLLTITRGQSERWVSSTGSWTLTDEDAGTRVRVLVGPRTIVGAVVMGDQSLSRPLARLVTEGVDLTALRPALEARPEVGIQLLTEFIRAWESDGTGGVPHAAN